MIKSGELQYLADSALIEKVLAEEFKLSLVKQAGALDFLSGAADAIKQQVQQQIHTDSVGGVVGGIANLMAPSILFRLHPIVGVLYLIGQNFGFDITGIFTKIMSALKPLLEKGLPISPEQVNDIGKSIVGSEAGPIETQASHFSSDLLEHLREPQINIKLAKPGEIPWFLGDKGAGPLQKIFGNLFATQQSGKARWLLGGFVIWIVKTILAGAGLLAVSGMAGKLIKDHLSPTSVSLSSGKPTSDDPSQPKIEETQPNQSAGYFSTISEKPSTSKSNQISSISLGQPSGRGEQTFPNDSQHLWVVPLVDNQVATTLWTWITDVYPSLAAQKNQIAQSSSFQQVTNLLAKNQHGSVSSLTMPQPFTSRKQVVDLALRSII